MSKVFVHKPGESGLPRDIRAERRTAREERAKKLAKKFAENALKRAIDGMHGTWPPRARFILGIQVALAFHPRGPMICLWTEPRLVYGYFFLVEPGSGPIPQPQYQLTPGFERRMFGT